MTDEKQNKGSGDAQGRNADLAKARIKFTSDAHDGYGHRGRLGQQDPLNGTVTEEPVAIVGIAAPDIPPPVAPTSPPTESKAE
jgi:hypothetical protein